MTKGSGNLYNSTGAPPARKGVNYDSPPPDGNCLLDMLHSLDNCYQNDSALPLFRDHHHSAPASRTGGAWDAPLADFYSAAVPIAHCYDAPPPSCNNYRLEPTLPQDIKADCSAPANKCGGCGGVSNSEPPNGCPALCLPGWFDCPPIITVPPYPAPPGVCILPISEGRNNKPESGCGGEKPTLPRMPGSCPMSARAGSICSTKNGRTPPLGFFGTIFAFLGFGGKKSGESKNGGGGGGE